MDTSTQVESSRDGWKCTREVDRLFSDARENVGEPSSQCRQRRSPERYTGCMALARECIETEPCSFEEAVQQPIWVDAMVEEYDSIVRNSVWDVVPRPENKSVVSSCWLYKVKQAAWKCGRRMGKCLCLKESMPMRYLGAFTWISASRCRLH